MTAHQVSRGGDPESNTPTQDEKDRLPKKYIGYQGFAEYLSLDDDFFALRRYDQLYCRVLITLQERIAILERKLQALDDEYSRVSDDDINNGTICGDQQDRQILLDKIATDLKAYADMVSSYRQLKSAPEAPSLNIRNIRTWLANNCGPIEAEEVYFLSRSDLITVTNSRKSSIRRLFEIFILSPTLGLWGLLGHRHGPDRTNVYGSDGPVNAISRIAIFLVATAMLIAPLWILAQVQDMKERLGVITAFIVALLFVLTAGTLAKPFEVLAVTAGYSAVLVVFLQIGGTLI